MILPRRRHRALAALRLLVICIACALLPAPTAADSPVPNNIVGLNLGRLSQERFIWAASDLVNANGGDWGYVTVTWTIDDRDAAAADYNLQQFLDRCFEYHVQPIMRVGTRFDTRRRVWAGPEWDEPAKWRAFFERGSWPTRRVWVIVGNEPNLGREWNGEVDAGDYTRYLAHFMDVFAGSDRFKVVNAPLDISNGTLLPEMQDAFQFIDGMREAVPNIFERLSAWASNPYRVPSGGNDIRYTHRAYEAELDAIGRELPVLITEAQIMETDDEEEIARFFETAFRDWMADPLVVAATPLFWYPDKNQFWMFSVGQNGAIQKTSPTYFRMRGLPRVAGSPTYAPLIANAPRAPKPPEAALPVAAPESQFEVVRAPGQVAGGDVGAPPPVAWPLGSARVAHTAGRGANLRAEPGILAPLVVTLPDGSLVQTFNSDLEADGFVWRLVRTDDGLEGWIVVDLLAGEEDE